MEDPSLETLSPLECALVMAALADGRSRLSGVHPDARTRLLLDGLVALGVAATSDASTGRIDVAGTGGYWPNSDAELHAGDSPAIACLLTAACSIGRGQYAVACDGPAAPLLPLMNALADVRASVAHEESNERLVIRSGPESIKGGTVWLSADCPEFVLQSLLTVAPYSAGDVMIAAHGSTDQTTGGLLPLMDLFGVSVLEDGGRFVVAAPQRYRSRELAAPFRG